MLRQFACFALCFALSAVFSCNAKHDNTSASDAAVAEDSLAMAAYQGVWADELTGRVLFRISGDSICYPHNNGLAVSISVDGDTLKVGDKVFDKYIVESRTENTLMLVDTYGEQLSLVRSVNPDDSLLFSRQPKSPLVYGQLIKRDTILHYNNVRYRVYTTINPSKYKVYNTSVNEDGLKVQNVYYDNIINIAIFSGAQRLYSCNFYKKMFSGKLPGEIFEHTIFGDMVFKGVSDKGFSFDAVIGVPDEVGAYVIDTVVYKP